MSFFIRKRGGSSSHPNKLTDRVNGAPAKKQTGVGRRGPAPASFSAGGRKRKRGVGRGNPPPPSKLQKPQNDEEITSESDNEEDHEETHSTPDHSDGEEETPQEARVRLAKDQIKELKKQLLEKHGVVDDELVGGVLREQELVEEGKVLRNVLPSGFADKELSVDVVLRGKVLKTPITSITSTPTSIYTSTKSGKLIHYNMLTKKTNTTTLTPPPITSIALTQSTLAASTPSSIHLLNPTTLQITHTFTNSRNATFLSISPETLYSTHKDRTIKLWNLQERAYVESLFGHQDIPTSVDVLGGNRIVSSGGFDKTVRVWKIEEESQLVYNWDEDVIDYVKVLSGGYFVASSCGGNVGLFSFGRKKPLSVIKQAHGLDQHDVARWVTCVGGQGDLVITGSDHGVIKVWKVVCRKLEYVRDVVVPEGVVIGVDVHVEEDAVRFVVGIGTELRNGRWSGRKSNCSKIVIVT